MSLSATSVALILSIVSSAHGSNAVLGDVREGAPTTETKSVEEAAIASVPDKAGEGSADAEPAPPTAEDEALYSRLFQDEATKAPEASEVVDEAKASVWPWWVWPVGMMTIGVLFLMRGKARETLLPAQAIRVVSRSALGKDGTLAVVEVADGDHRTRRLLVGFGSGAPRLVADVSAWDVAVAAPAPESAAAPHHTGPDPLMAVPGPRAVQEDVGAATTFGGTLQAARARYEEAAPAPQKPAVAPVQRAAAHEDLVAEVLKMRDAKELNPSGGSASKRRPAYSRREVVA